MILIVFFVAFSEHTGLPVPGKAVMFIYLTESSLNKKYHHLFCGFGSVCLHFLVYFHTHLSYLSVYLIMRFLVVVGMKRRHYRYLQ